MRIVLFIIAAIILLSLFFKLLKLALVAGVVILIGYFVYNFFFGTKEQSQ